MFKHKVLDAIKSMKCGNSVLGKWNISTTYVHENCFTE